MGDEIDGNTILARALKEQVNNCRMTRWSSAALIAFCEYKVQLFFICFLYRMSSMFSGLSAFL